MWITSAIKKCESTLRKRKKHDEIIFLAKNDLNNIEALISNVLKECVIRKKKKKLKDLHIKLNILIEL